ncbi:MAG: dihydroorotate dehydrogenase [Clostridiales Family XIII bacterium]|jgi:dihydroorotate dehydrogenase subfamily 1|nr:dihydroorotate dehydrogenase [Clostridiales Family XIII bacterium]
MSIEICGLRWKNPITTASGTFSARDSGQYCDFSLLGAVTTKGVAMEPWMGNPTPRIAESWGGVLNAVGLENPGVDAYINEEIPYILDYIEKGEASRRSSAAGTGAGAIRQPGAGTDPAQPPTAAGTGAGAGRQPGAGADPAQPPHAAGAGAGAVQPRTRIIANIVGKHTDEYRAVAERLDGSAVDMIELNISCPNIKAGGIGFGTDARLAAEVVSAVRAATGKPLIVKLSPNVTDITEIAKAAEAAGADALSLINTLLGMRIDIKRRSPVLANVTGGLSGPAIKPVAVRMVYQTARAVKIPLIGMGGIMTGEDAAEFFMAGASAVAAGTAALLDPAAPVRILNGLEGFMRLNGFADIEALKAALG